MARQATKGKVSSYPRLDARLLGKKHGHAVGSEFVTRLQGGWGRPSTRAVVSMLDDRLHVTVGDLLPLCWPIGTTKTSLNFRGGCRLWMECPSCDSRCRVIYFRGNTPPGCRTCLNLAYDSQSQDRMVRTFAANHKVYARLGWNRAEPAMWRRPKGMWRNTLFALTRQLETGFARLRTELEKSTLLRGHPASTAA